MEYNETTTYNIEVSKCDRELIKQLEKLSGRYDLNDADTVQLHFTVQFKSYTDTLELSDFLLAYGIDIDTDALETQILRLKKHVELLENNLNKIKERKV